MIRYLFCSLFHKVVDINHPDYDFSKMCCECSRYWEKEEYISLFIMRRFIWVAVTSPFRLLVSALILWSIEDGIFYKEREKWIKELKSLWRIK